MYILDIKLRISTIMLYTVANLDFKGLNVVIYRRYYDTNN
jgi:hypothetical protein